jgi:hypothetical protein
MEIAIYICDSPAALIEAQAELTADDSVLYMTPDDTPETGEIFRYLVKPPRSPGARLDSFAGKFVLVALRSTEN